MKILLWGAGDDGQRLVRDMQEDDRGIFCDDVIGIIDRDAKKWGTRLRGIPILEPDAVHSLSYDDIVISSLRYEKEIRSDLEQHMGITPEKILLLETYRANQIIAYQCSLAQKHMGGTNPTYTPFDTDNFVIYTAIVGNYDTLKDPAIVEDGVRYVCFTDQPQLESDVWEIRQIDRDPTEPPAMAVRDYKLLPHRYLPDAQTSVWIDASFQIVGSIRDLLKRYQKRADILLFPHPGRMCAYEEVAECIRLRKDRKEKLMRQAMDYFADGLPFDVGLMCGGFLARNHDVKMMRDAMDAWHHEVSERSLRDQISLSYILWKKKIPFDLVPMNLLEKNTYVKNNFHLNV